MIAVVDRLAEHRLLPVVAVDAIEAAEPLAVALRSGGLPVVEVTFRTPAARAALEAMAADPAMLVGAGTVLDIEQVDEAADAGARFVVSPGFDADVVGRSRERGLLPIPGVATATELQAARRAGLGLVKFFPAATIGGVAALRALQAPFPSVRFVPTGGIGAEDVPSYLELPAVAAVGGSFIVPQRSLAQRDWHQITVAVEQAVSQARGDQTGGNRP